MTTTIPHAQPTPASSPAVASAREKANILTELVDILSWIKQTIVELPRALRYPVEILRQLATMVLSSTFVIWFMLFAGGFYIGEIGHYLLGQIGAQAYAGLFASAATVKAADQLFFGFIVAAKVGCGYVAELGAMRINEEIDAMRVMGIPTRSYLVGTRVWASIIAIPFITAAFVAFAATYIVDVLILQTASSGGFLFVYWTFATPMDLFVTSLIWTFIPTVLAIIVACFYGYNAGGGPVGVGAATARSMAVNLIIVTVLGGGILFQLFYGTGVILPIGN